MTATTAELRRSLRRSFQAFEDKWVRRCSAPLTLVYADGSEEEIGPPTEVNFDLPLNIRYIWKNVPFPKALLAVRFDGAGRPMPVSAGGWNTITWGVRIEWDA